MNRNTKRILILLAVFVIIAAFIIVASKLNGWIFGDDDGGSALEEKLKMKTVYLDGQPYIQRENTKTYLVIGLDTFGEMQSSKSYYNTVQNDFLFLVQTDSENRVCSMLHINRDTMADIDKLGIGGVKYGMSFEQIALAHTYGDGMRQSCVNTKNAVSRLLHGIKIDYYVAMTMDAVIAINDYMGGVSVQIPYDMTNIDESFVVGANVNLLGEASLKFIRARSELEDSSNLSRMERQRIYIKAFLEKISDISITNAFIDSMYSTADKYILTDCPAKNVDEFVKNIGEYEIGDIETVPGEAKLGAEFMEYYADDEKLQKLIAGLFYEKLDK